MEIDFDAHDEDEPTRSGEYGLWLAVVTNAVLHLLQYRSELARQFIFDPENPFFQMVCERLGYDAAAVREQIRARLHQGAVMRRSGTRPGEDMTANPD